MSVISVNLMSTVLECPVDVTMVVPNPHVFSKKSREFYTSGKKYRVLWLMHGGNCDSKSWLTYTNLVRYAAGRDIFIIMFSGLNTDFSNQPQFTDGYNVMDFYFDELRPFVENWFPVSRDGRDHSAAGYSMGAAAAWMFGIYRPECFGRIIPIGSMYKDYSWLESYRDMDAAEFRASALADPRAYPAGYGNPSGGIHLKEVNMITKYPTPGDFLDSPEHTVYRFRERLKDGSLPEIYVFADSGDKGYASIRSAASDPGLNGAVNFIMSDYGLNEYDFCDRVLPDVLDICAGA